MFDRIKAILTSAASRHRDTCDRPLDREGGVLPPSAFQRSGRSSPIGKLTAIIPAMRIPLETFEGATVLAHEAELPLNEWIRLLVMERVHGKEELLRLERERLERVSGKCGDR